MSNIGAIVAVKANTPEELLFGLKELIKDIEFRVLSGSSGYTCDSVWAGGGAGTYEGNWQVKLNPEAKQPWELYPELEAQGTERREVDRQAYEREGRWYQ